MIHHPPPCHLPLAFPTPDNMLTDMFNEIDIDKEGSVEFEVFLARMNYKIQGRFSSDVVKSMFRSVCAAESLDPTGLDWEAGTR